MANYTPPSGDNVVLNFKDLATDSTELNFGAEANGIFATLDAVITIGFNAEITAVYVGMDSINAIISTTFTAEIVAVYADTMAVLDAVIDTAFMSQIDSLFDINFILGVNALRGFGYQLASERLTSPVISWAKPIFKAHQSAFTFERGLTISNSASAGFDRSTTLSQSIQQVFQQAKPQPGNWSLAWQDNQRIRTVTYLAWDESVKLRIQAALNYEEMIRKRKQITFSHEVARQFEKRFVFDWDNGLELLTYDAIAWDKAKPVYYRKSTVEPWPAPTIPQYVGSGDLNFVCLCTEVDPHNVILNFGADDCIPALPIKDWWYIVNEMSVTRLDNGQEIAVYNGDYRCDRSSWCWSYGLTIPAYELSKVEPINGQPVILKIMINGHEHRMLLENRTRSRQFGKDTYKLSGRSPIALLDAPYAPTRSFTQENERTSVQLAQAELDRVNSDVALNWQLIDALGWILPTDSMSYSNQTPITAIKSLVEAAGGFVYSEPDSNTLSIKPLYKKTFWDPIAIEEYDRLIPESLVSDQSTDYESYPDYNGVFITNDRTGDTGQVKRVGTAGDILFEPFNSPLLTTVAAMHSKGRSLLAKAGMVESHSMLMPVTAEVGLCKPGELIAFDAAWWGIVDSVSGSFSYSKVTQTVVVERVNHG